MDKDQKLVLTITLESGDGDQLIFAQRHPKAAAEGERRFSYDSYQETGLNSSGQRTQTHYTYQIFEGQPSYTSIRESFMKIAQGEMKPTSSRAGLIVQ